MFHPTQQSNTIQSQTNQNRTKTSRWHVFLICPLLICIGALYANYRQPPTTYATAPNEAQNVSAAATVQEQTKSASARYNGPLAATPSIWPAKGIVTSGFGWRLSPFGSGNEKHAGIDIAGNAGLPVVATADGRVVQSGPVGEYGNMVQIDHGNGIATIYGHNSRLAVSVGQTVRKGQIISYIGSTGKSTGPHLHYEVRKNGSAVNPWSYLVSY